jgi:two-component system response regulator
MPPPSTQSGSKRDRAEKRTRHLPVVIFTSSSEDWEIAESYDLGANAYVRKPVECDRFTEAIRHLGPFWISINEPSPGGMTVH